MAQVLVRKLRDDVKEALKRQAQAHGRSLEEEARRILEAGLIARSPEADEGLGTRIARLFEGLEPLPEDFADRLRNAPLRAEVFDDDQAT